MPIPLQFFSFSKQSYMNRVKPLVEIIIILVCFIQHYCTGSQKWDKTEFNKFVDNYYEEGFTV
jgi:hypothetical protein